jgi:hypothetical protein
MSDFSKTFLLEDSRKFSPNGKFVGLAAFGKHPGWDDHVEDLGLETESLNSAKLMLYVNGIGRQIDSGAWEKLDATQLLPGFRHLFVWQRSGQILVGRLWSSSDGKGRKRYPMVVCIHFIGVTLGWALKQSLPVLAELEQECSRTSSAAEVRSLLSRKRAALREAIQSTDAKGEYAPVTPERLHTILNPANEASREGFLRVLYQVQSQLGGFAPGVFNVRTNPTSLRVQQIRAPIAASDPEQALLFWTRFFLVYIDSSVPLLLTVALETDWIDITIGEPESHEMFCLRANPKAVPKTSEIPYKLDDGFRAKAVAFLEAFRRGETYRPDLNPIASPAAPTPPTKRSGWLKSLGIGSLLAVLAVVAWMFLSKNIKPELSPGVSIVKNHVPQSGTNLMNVSSTVSANTAQQKPTDLAPAPNEITNTIGMVLVLLPSGIWAGKYEVTRGEYTQVMQTNANNTRWQVTWNDAVEFTRRLTDLERSNLPVGKVYSLPTQKQWKEFSAGQTFEVLAEGTAAQKDPGAALEPSAANRFGLFDVNPWEWCSDDPPGDEKLFNGRAYNDKLSLRPEEKSLRCGFRCVLGVPESH